MPALNNDRSLIMDIVAEPPGDGQCLYVDTTVINPDCRSHSRTASSVAFQRAHALKLSKYGAVALANGCAYMTFAVDTYGRMSKETRDFVNKIAASIKLLHSSPSTPITNNSATISALSQALMLGNGMCLYRRKFLKKIGVDLDAPPLEISAPPVPLTSGPAVAALSLVGALGGSGVLALGSAGNGSAAQASSGAPSAPLVAVTRSPPGDGLEDGEFDECSIFSASVSSLPAGEDASDPGE